MKASRFPGRSSVHSVRKLASEPPFVRVTLAAVAPGYHEAMAARVASDPSESG
jgi:hypothetical protein